MLYNAALRGLPKRDFVCLMGNLYETTIFAIASGVTKLAKATNVPKSRVLYRGLNSDLVLPEQFWQTGAECTIKITIHTCGADAAIKAVNALMEKVESQEGVAAIDGTFMPVQREQLVLPLPQGKQVTQQEKHQIQAHLVQAADVSGCSVKLTVSLPGSKEVNEAGQLDRLRRAVHACCAVEQPNSTFTIQMDVEEKPEGFRGGVELGLLSLSESRATALRYGSTGGRRGTVFEVQVGRVDIGASISLLSQYPREQEFLMPPLSCLEVIGKPRIDHDSDGAEVVVLPLRVNVNLKAQSVEDLIGRRKLLHAAATKNLREELSRSADEQTERFGVLLKQRRAGALEQLRPVADLTLRNDGSAVKFRGSTYGTVGAPYLALSAGKVYFEVEILEGVPRSTLGIGFAGTLICGTAGIDVGDDALSWAIFSFGKARHNDVSKPLAAAAGWFIPGTILAVAVDLDEGRMLAAMISPGSVCDREQKFRGKWEEVYSEGVMPGSKVGGSLFPILTGGWGASCKCNFGHSEMQIHPPDSGYCPIAHAAKEYLVKWELATERSNNIKEAEHILDGLGMNQRSLLDRFDEIRVLHEAMEAEEYNVDDVYRDNLDEILMTKVCAVHKQKVIVDLLLAGAAPSQLSILKAAPATDFRHTGAEALGEECSRYSWRLVLSGWFRFLNIIQIPLKPAPSLIALVWRAVFDAAAGRGKVQGDMSGECMVEIGERKAPVAALLPVFRLQDAGLQSQRFENAVLGLTLVAVSMDDIVPAESPKEISSPGASSTAASPLLKLMDADFRHLEFSKQRILELARVILAGRISGTLQQVNGLEVTSPGHGQNLRDHVRRSNRQPVKEKDAQARGLGIYLDPIDWGFIMAEAKRLHWRELDVSFNCVDPKGATGIAVGLGSVLSLAMLDLSNNQLHEAGMAAIGSALTALTALSRLELSNNCLGGKGGSNLAIHLRGLSSLISLGLANNALAADGGSAVCCALATNCKRLRRLDLSNNALGQIGGEAVASALRELQSLTVVSMCGQDVGSAVWHVLEQLVPRASALAVDSGVVKVECNLEKQAVSNLESSVELVLRRALGPDGARRLANIVIAGRMQLSGRLRSLELAYNSILAEGIIALEAALKELSALTRLGLAANNIGKAGASSLANGLRELLQLQSLSLEGNSICPRGWSALTDAVEKLSSLTFLNGFDQFKHLREGTVSKLEISGKEVAPAIAPMLFRSASLLSVLDISANSIDAQCRGESDNSAAAEAACRLLTNLGEFEVLSVLKLSDNSFGSCGGTALSEVLCRLGGLTVLELARTLIGKDGAFALAKGLRQLTVLRLLGLAENQIGAIAIGGLCEALPSASMEELDLGCNALGPSGATALARCLKVITRIQTLKLPGNFLGQLGGEALADSLCLLSGLTNLDLHGNNLGPVGVRAIVNCLVGVARDSETVCPSSLSSKVVPLSTLNLGDNQLNIEGGVVCAARFSRLSTLQEVNLAGNGLGLVGCRAVFAALVPIPILCKLDLSESGLEEECWETLGEQLGNLTSLHTLCLGGNNLGSAGAIALFAGITRLSTLKSLDLTNTELGPQSCLALVEGLSRLSALRELTLEANLLGPEGGRAVAEIVIKMPYLQELNLRNNALGVDGTRIVEELIATHNPQLKHDLRWNGQAKCSGSLQKLAPSKLLSVVSAVVERRPSLSTSLMHGSLHKLGQDKALDDEHGWRERLCFIKGGKLLYKSNKKKGEPELIAEIAAICNVVPVFDAGPPGFYVFRVEADTDTRRTSTLAAETAQDRDRWISFLIRMRDSLIPQQ